ncbi:MAG: NAD(+)/NADH kinase [Candidatus Ranarchaeia archaeon]
MNKLSVVIKPNCEEADKFFLERMEKIKQQFNLEIDPLTAKRLDLYEYSTSISEMDGELLLILGGDGTLLFALNNINNSEIPIFGINFGERGFLMEIEPSEFDLEWEKIKEKKYTIQEIPKISGKINSKNIPDALNEQYLFSSVPTKMLEIEISIDNNSLIRGKMDGVIIASTIGSTGHALSAGGPIIHPSVECLEIVPIFPLKLNFKPLLVSLDSKIKVSLLQNKREGKIVSDGSIINKIPSKSEIVFYKSKNNARFVRLKESYYNKLQEKIFRRG